MAFLNTSRVVYVFQISWIIKNKIYVFTQNLPIKYNVPTILIE